VRPDRPAAGCACSIVRTASVKPSAPQHEDFVFSKRCAESGMCSAIAAEQIAQLGYRNVRDYHEGKADWVGWVFCSP